MEDTHNRQFEIKALRNVHQMHIEVSRACNLNCTYCYAEAPKRPSNLFMPLETALNYIDLIFERSCSPRVEVVFHGGEPLLQSARWFDEVIQYAQDKAAITKKEIRFLMQSNGLALTESKLKVITKYQIKVGISLDGPPHINDVTRGQGECILKNIKRLQHANCFGGVGCVISNSNFDRMAETLSFFEKRGMHYMMANPVRIVGCGTTLKPLSASQILAASLGIYSYLSNLNGAGVLEAHVVGMLSRFLHPPTMRDFEEILICSHPFCGAGISIIFCDIDGYLYPCGCSHNQTFILAHISSISDADFYERVSAFHRKSTKYYADCNTCSSARICAFGCPAFDRIDPVTESSICESTKRFYSFLTSENAAKIERIVNNLRGSSHEN